MKDVYVSTLGGLIAAYAADKVGIEGLSIEWWVMIIAINLMNKITWDFLNKK